jgi:hypothetical protein
MRNDILSSSEDTFYSYGASKKLENYFEYLSSPYRPLGNFGYKNETVYRIGDKVHLLDKNGIYKILRVEGNCTVIICKKWQIMFMGGQYEFKEFKTPIENIKCLAGGRNYF